MVAKSTKRGNGQALIECVKEICTSDAVYEECKVVGIIAVSMRLVTFLEGLLDASDDSVDASTILDLNLKNLLKPWNVHLRYCHEKCRVAIDGTELIADRTGIIERLKQW